MSGVETVTAGGADASIDDNNEKSAEQVVTPWDVEAGADGKIDYMKLVNDFKSL